MLFFDWIRRSVRNSVIEGFNQAMTEIVGVGQQVPETPAVRLLLPGPSQEEETSEETGIEKKPRRKSS